MSLFWSHRASTLSIVLARWSLVVTIAYAIIMSGDTAVPLWPQHAFVAVILIGHLLLTAVASRGKTWQTIQSFTTGADIAAASMAITVAGNVSAGFYLAYFTVLILAAVLRGRALLMTMALMVCVAYGTFLFIEDSPQALQSAALLVRVPVLLGVAFYFGTGVQVARTEQERQAEQRSLERQKALSALTEMGNVALAGSYPGPVLYELAGWVQEIVEFDRCSLLVFGDGGKLGYVAASGDDPSIEVLALKVGDYPELGPVLDRGEHTEIHPGEPPDLWDEVQERLPDDSPFRTFIVIPIKRGDAVSGAFYLRDSDPQRQLSEAQLAFSLQAANMASAFIHEHELLDKLEARSRQDQLTGLVNYRAFIEAAEARIAGAGPEGEVGMAVIDIDRLSEVNQRFGHNAGTDLITRVARQLAEGAGEAIVSRYGGGEFIVLTDGSADELRSRLQGGFLDPLVSQNNDHPAEPRASIGISSSPRDGASAELLFAAARQALRDAKAGGGHQIRTSGLF